MSWQQPELFSSNHSNTSSNYSFIDSVQKPVEIYVFIDPLSEECWSLQTYLKKLTMEYGRFFTIRPIVSGYLSLINNSNCELTRDISANAEESYIGETKVNYLVDQPWITSLAIKAAELQGKRAGKKFLRKLQEKLFLEKLNVSVQDVLLECAKDANLDLQEFERDLFSSSAENAYKCDRRLTREMDVDHLPTMVFFNQVVEEHGIKVSGLYPYEIYELVLSEILQHNPIPSTKPSLEEFVTRYSLVGTKEISIVYDWTLQKAEKEMKKLQFKQKVERVSGDYGGFWRAVN